MESCAGVKSVTKSSEDGPSFQNTGSADAEDAVTSSNRGMKRYFEDENTNHYPKALKLMFGPLSCDLCSVNATSTLTMFTHYKGKTHQKKVDRYLKEHSVEVDNSNKKVKKDFVTTTCDICNVILTSEIQSLQHYSGKSHKKKMANSGGVPVVKVPMESYDSSGRFGIGKSFASPTPNQVEKSEETPKGPNDNVRFCSVCKVFMTSDETLSSHMQGAKHLKKLELEKAVELNSLSKYRTPSDYYYCPLCNVSANSPDQFLLHLKSKKHTNFTKKEAS